MLLNCGAGEELLRVPWIARRSRQSILNEINPEYSLEGLMLKLTQWKRPRCWERLKAGGEGDDREWDGWMGSPTRWTWVWASSGSWLWTGKPGILQSMGSQNGELNWVIELNRLVGCSVPCNRKCHKRWTSKSFAFFSFSSQTHHRCSDVIHVSFVLVLLPHTPERSGLTTQ